MSDQAFVNFSKNYRVNHFNQAKKHLRVTKKQ